MGVGSLNLQQGISLVGLGGLVSGEFDPSLSELSDAVGTVFFFVFSVVFSYLTSFFFFFFFFFYFIFFLFLFCDLVVFVVLFIQFIVTSS